MKNIIFTIKTAYSEERYFLSINNSESIETQIDKALSKISFCDAYNIMSYSEVDEKYVEERKYLICQYEKKYGPMEDSFCSGDYVLLESIKNEMERRKNNNERNTHT